MTFINTLKEPFLFKPFGSSPLVYFYLLFVFLLLAMFVVGSWSAQSQRAKIFNLQFGDSDSDFMLFDTRDGRYYSHRLGRFSKDQNEMETVLYSVADTIDGCLNKCMPALKECDQEIRFLTTDKYIIQKGTVYFPAAYCVYGTCYYGLDVPLEGKNIILLSRPDTKDVDRSDNNITAA